MALYFFDVDDGIFMRDEIGTELADDKCALVEARQAMAELGKDLVSRDGLGTSLSMVVRNAEGKALFELRLTFAVDDAPPSS